MADKQDFNDDYQFADLDTGTEEHTEGDASSPKTSPPSDTAARNKIIRNAVIAVAIFMLSVLVYKFLTAKKSPPVKTAPPKVAQAPIKPIQPIQPTVVKPIQIEKPPQVDALALEKKVNAIEVSLQSTRDVTSALGTQLNSINTNISDMSGQITKLNQTVETLSATVTQQSNTIAVLEKRLEKPKPIVRQHTHHRAPAPIFYIQAVVPGRAWIISTNGSTLTVREGSTIPGYGVVKLIDAQQGRIVTGSGRVIKFSQEDS